MIMKTHLAAAFAMLFLFLPIINNRLVFFPVILLASLFPDIDSASSYIGNSRLLRIFQFFVKHRGAIHSVTLCFIFSVLIALAYPAAALPFFLGYSVHLFLDSMTIDGITPFWPLKGSANGALSTGGKIENVIFWCFTAIAIIFLVFVFI